MRKRWGGYNVQRIYLHQSIGRYIVNHLVKLEGFRCRPTRAYQLKYTKHQKMFTFMYIKSFISMWSPTCLIDLQTADSWWCYFTLHNPQYNQPSLLWIVDIQRNMNWNIYWNNYNRGQCFVFEQFSCCVVSTIHRKDPLLYRVTLEIFSCLYISISFFRLLLQKRYPNCSVLYGIDMKHTLCIKTRT